MKMRALNWQAAPILACDLHTQSAASEYSPDLERADDGSAAVADDPE